MVNEQLPLSSQDLALSAGFGAPILTTILVVEDNRPLNQALTQLLSDEGYRVLRAFDGTDAVELLHQETPDLVLSDVIMPHMDGFALLAHIRNDVRLHYLPFIFLTAYGEAEERRRAQEWGVDDYLDKPIDNRLLLEKIRLVLRRHMVVESSVRRRVDNVRNQILGLIQHEFRTPLTLIMGYAEYMQESLNSDANRQQLKESVNAILEGSRRLHHLVESFLLLANLSRDELPEDEIFPLDPTALWRETVSIRADEFQASGLTIRYLEPPDPVIAYGVMDILREALVRLLDNAFTYRRAGSRFVELSTVVKPGYVGWSIQDEGPGIPLPLLAELSAPFVRTQTPPASTHGAGLSLTLVRRVAELHGGHLQIESREGVGSTFTLWVADRDV